MAPQLVQAYARYSVAFDERPDGSYLVYLPPCGVLDTAFQGPAFETVQLANREVLFEASVPLAPCHAPSTTKAYRLFHFRQPISHAPVGPLLSTTQ
jgi:hypothetical protein